MFRPATAENLDIVVSDARCYGTSSSFAHDFHSSHPMLGIATSAKVATLEEAKAQFRQNWQRAKAHSRAYGRSGDADKGQSADT